jgi:hypothetical protein
MILTFIIAYYHEAQVPLVWYMDADNSMLLHEGSFHDFRFFRKMTPFPPEHHQATLHINIK